MALQQNSPWHFSPQRDARCVSTTHSISPAPVTERQRAWCCTCPFAFSSKELPIEGRGFRFPFKNYSSVFRLEAKTLSLPWSARAIQSPRAPAHGKQAMPFTLCVIFPHIKMEARAVSTAVCFTVTVFIQKGKRKTWAVGFLFGPLQNQSRREAWGRCSSLRAHQVKDTSHHQEPVHQILNIMKPIFMHPVLTADAPLQWDVISERSMQRTKEHLHWLLDCFYIRKKSMT